MTAGKLLERKSPVGGWSGRGFSPRERTSAGSPERCRSVPSSSEAPLGSDPGPCTTAVPRGGRRKSQETGSRVLKAAIFRRNLNKTLSNCAAEAICVSSYYPKSGRIPHAPWCLPRKDSDPDTRARLLHPEVGGTFRGASPSKAACRRDNV